MASYKEDFVEMGTPVDPEMGASNSVEKPSLVARKSSTLDRHDDPFAQREGKTLTWRQVNMTLVSILVMCVVVVLLGRRVYAVCTSRSWSSPSSHHSQINTTSGCHQEGRRTKAPSGRVGRSSQEGDYSNHGPVRCVREAGAFLFL